MRNRNVAMILAFFFGWAGGHKFYLGQTSKGVLYLIFFWTWIPAFVSIIELIILASMDDVKFNMLYNVPAGAQVQFVGVPVPQYLQPAPSPSQLPPAPPQNIVVNVANTATAAGGDITVQLKSLHELHVAGALTDEEFNTQKQRLLASAK